ncbi:MAG: hypothetical protein KH756_09620, partial [Firmicutes bacterium]|nr:hypothetical protein [Bacillota bacterium]
RCPQQAKQRGKSRQDFSLCQLGGHILFFSVCHACSCPVLFSISYTIADERPKIHRQKTRILPFLRLRVGPAANAAGPIRLF